MTERAQLHQQAQQFFDGLWGQGDHWELESSAFEQQRYAHLLAFLPNRPYSRILELGCGAGTFTHALAPLAEHVIALDISAAAIARAHRLWPQLTNVEFRQTNVMDYNPHEEGPWDLVVLSDTMCYLGWLYSCFDVGWFASQLYAATRWGGVCLFANAMGVPGDMLLLPWLIRSYQALLCNVGYTLETEQVFRGTKHDVSIEVLMSLHTKMPTTMWV